MKFEIAPFTPEQTIFLGTIAFIAAIALLWWEMNSIPYRPGCRECDKAEAVAIEEKKKSAGQNKSDQRNPPGAGFNGGGWAT